MRSLHTTFLSLLASFLLGISSLANAEINRINLIPSKESHSISVAASLPAEIDEDLIYKGLPKHIKAPTYKVFVFDPRHRAWAAYDKNGFRVTHGVANGGADFCDELNEPCRTPIGHFKITRRGGANCASGQFPVGKGGAAMPYCMFFKNGCAIHGSPYVSAQNTSHGCIRVLTPAAKWLSHYFLKYNTRVIVLPY